MSTTGFQIAALTELDEFERCVELQLAVWGYSESETIPRRMFLLASKIGGQVLGAWVGAEMAGFAMAIPGFRNGHAYLHSHMLAVLPPYRNLGIGKALKLAQREEALGRGFELMEWTFDPLSINNAHLNITKLGAISRKYRANFYGPSSSPLQGGLPTDRLYAEWWLRSRRVKEALSGQAPGIEAQQVVEVPKEIIAWKQDPGHREQALALQLRNREALQTAFADGLAVIGCERTAEGDGRLLLGTWDEKWIY